MRFLIALLVLGFAVSLAPPVGAAAAQVIEASAAVEVIEDVEPEVDAVATARVVRSISLPSHAVTPAPEGPPHAPAAPPPVPPPER